MINLEHQRVRILERLNYYLDLPAERPESYYTLKATIIPKLRRALVKISVGTYFQCDSCGGDIEAKRLEKVPGALLCFNCQVNEDRVK